MSGNKQNDNTSNESNNTDADSDKDLKSLKAESHDLIKHSEISKDDKKEFHKLIKEAENEKQVEIVMDNVSKAETIEEAADDASQGGGGGAGGIDVTVENSGTEQATTTEGGTSSTTVEESEPIFTKLEKLHENPQFRKFLQIQYITEELKTDPEELSNEDKQKLIVKFNAWQLAGGPVPRMDEIKTDSKKISVEKVYRFKHLGAEKLRWLTADGTMHGKNKKGEWNTEYTETKAKKLVEQAIATCLKPKFFIIGTQKFAVTDPKNFIKPFNEACKMGRDGSL